MRRARFFFLKYKPIWVAIFVMGFFVQAGYIFYLKNQNEPTEIPKCNHLLFVYDYVTKDAVSIKVNFIIDYNKDTWFWGAFHGERKIKNCIIRLFNDMNRGYDLSEVIERVGETEHKLLMRSLYEAEQECAIDIYRTDINISLSKQAMNYYINQKESERRTKSLCSKKH